MISLSTAESELLEIIEGFTLGESTSVVFEEVMGDFPRCCGPIVNRRLQC